jgi:hypothetical protein
MVASHLYFREPPELSPKEEFLDKHKEEGDVLRGGPRFLADMELEVAETNFPSSPCLET